MTQLQQQSSYIRRRKSRDARYQRICNKLSNWRRRKAEIRQERIVAGWRPEPKFVRAYRFEFGVRDKATGEMSRHDLKSVRHAAKALGLILKYV